MNRAPIMPVLTLLLALSALFAAGCSNPDAPVGGDEASEPASPQNPGEPPAPGAPNPSMQRPADVQASATGALAAFAARYSNWSYQTLAGEQRALAAISVGAARLSELQAAAASQGESTVSRGHIHNSGQIISIAADIDAPGMWAIVTREQTSGSDEYEGLPAAYHVTLAKLAAVAGGYAVSEWLPQS